MGVVVAATHLQLRQQIAVKLLRPEAMANPSLIERFEREARAAARVHGEHVARVIDVGKLPGGLPYIVMEYLEGEDLERTLRRRGQLPIEETIDYLLQTCEAVAEAHAANIVHRDLKPANLFLATRPNEDAPILKVLDFGISKILEPETDAITHTSALMGTAYYMSPEQLTSAKKVDTRTDVWALGVIIYELLTGKRPFEAGTMPEVVAQILENTPTPLQSLRPDVPDELCDVVSGCLRRMDERLPTVADLATALAPFAPAHALPLVSRVNKLVSAAGKPRTPSVPVAENQHRIAVEPMVDSQGATAMGVTQVDPEPKTEIAANAAPAVRIARDDAAEEPDAPVARRRSRGLLALGSVALLSVVGAGALAASKHDRPEAAQLVGTIGNSSATASALATGPTPSEAPSTPLSAAPSATPSARAVVLTSAAPSARTRPPLPPRSGTGTFTGVRTDAVPSSSAPKNPLDMGPLK